MRGVEATPLYADGVLYNTLPWNITTAYDARTGKRLWTYDPKTPREYGRYACCEPVARGLCHVERQDHHRHARRADHRARREDGSAGLDDAGL